MKPARQDCGENPAKEAFKERLELVALLGLRGLLGRSGRGGNRGHLVSTD